MRERCAGAAGGGGGLAPQELLAASEQGWSNPPSSARARPLGPPSILPQPCAHAA